EASINRQNVSENIRNFLRVEPASSREQYRWMERFVVSVIDEPLRERLVISIDGKGAFRRFKDVLLAYPAERERWFSYRADLLHWHIAQWLEQHEISTSNEPPWGTVEPPQELPAVGRPVVHGSETPGEALRRQARELIETIAAIEPPTALAMACATLADGVRGTLGARELEAARFEIETLMPVPDRPPRVAASDAPDVPLSSLRKR